MNPKFIVGFFLVLLICSVPIYAIPKIKFYGKIDKAECSATIKSIPSSFYEKLKVIKVFEKKNIKYGGMYYLGGVIELYGGCNKIILVHELAHHQQYMHKEKYYDLLNHKGNFSYFENLHY